MNPSRNGRGLEHNQNEFAKMLTDVAATDARIHVMDFTKHIGNHRNDWHDELHLTWDGYRIAASHYAQLIRDNL